MGRISFDEMVDEWLGYVKESMQALFSTRMWFGEAYNELWKCKNTLVNGDQGSETVTKIPTECSPILIKKTINGRPFRAIIWHLDHSMSDRNI